MKNFSLKKWVQSALALLLLSFFFASCDKNEADVEDPIASFQYAISESNYLEVSFTNYSENASSYLWDFGDDNTSTDENPVHTYDAAGSYTVVLEAVNDEGVSKEYSETIEITDPNEARKLLTGETSKTWKLYREGVSASSGPSAESPDGWYSLSNDGSRPCLYMQTFTFHADGKFVFDDAGYFWGEYGVWGAMDGYENTPYLETCFDITETDCMLNAAGEDCSAWLSGEHTFEYDATTGKLTLNGTGSWIGVVKLGESDYRTKPTASTACNITITQETGYDLMTCVFDYGDGGYWTQTYVSYSDATLEPELVTEEEPYGEDLPNLTPTEMYHTFASNTDFAVLDTTAANGLSFTMGVADPASGSTAVGKYERWGEYQELQFVMQNDIQFDNFTTVSIDVYFPSSNDYSGSLTKTASIIIAESSQTEQWWTGHVQYDVDAADVQLDTWQTWTFQLDSPTSWGGNSSYSPLDRTDLDFFAISIGGAGHTDTGTFYVRNFEFN